MNSLQCKSGFSSVSFFSIIWELMLFLLRFCRFLSMETRYWLNCDDWKKQLAKNVNLHSNMLLTLENLFSIV